MQKPSSHRFFSICMLHIPLIVYHISLGLFCTSSLVVHSTSVGLKIWSSWEWIFFILHVHIYIYIYIYTDRDRIYWYGYYSLRIVVMFYFISLTAFRVMHVFCIYFSYGRGPDFLTSHLLFWYSFATEKATRHGPLARYAKLRVRMRWECRGFFPRHRR